MVYVGLTALWCRGGHSTSSLTLRLLVGPRQVGAISPDVAKVVIARGLYRPRAGMPAAWRRDAGASGRWRGRGRGASGRGAGRALAGAARAVVGTPMRAARAVGAAAGAVARFLNPFPLLAGAGRVSLQAARLPGRWLGSALRSRRVRDAVQVVAQAAAGAAVMVAGAVGLRAAAGQAQGLSLPSLPKLKLPSLKLPTFSPRAADRAPNSSGTLEVEGHEDEALIDDYLLREKTFHQNHLEFFSTGVQGMRLKTRVKLVKRLRSRKDTRPARLLRARRRFMNGDIP